MTRNKDIKSISFEDLCAYFSSLGQKPFRAQQVFEWLYQKGAQGFADMVNLPLALRTQLEKDFSFVRLPIVNVLTSKDRTQKFLFGVGDGEYIESVLIPARKRSTLCVSTQVGCKFACLFCASGLNGLKRNLYAQEIVEQILCITHLLKDKRISHVVFMGVGEPLDNYQEVFKAIRLINAPQGLGIAARRITVSTCGLIPQIAKMAEEGLQVELAVSLHAPNDAIRCQLMPINRTYPFDQLLSACRKYTQKTNRQITFEYILIKGLNDNQACARQLAKALKGMLAKVNLIACNQVATLGFVGPSPKAVVDFQKTLSSYGVISTVRLSRGEDVAAACGQLRYNLSKT